MVEGPPSSSGTTLTPRVSGTPREADFGDLARELREFSDAGEATQPETATAQPKAATATAQEVGSALYAESLEWITSDPMGWVRLEARKGLVHARG